MGTELPVCRRLTMNTLVSTPAEVSQGEGPEPSRAKMSSQCLWSTEVQIKISVQLTDYLRAN